MHWLKDKNKLLLLIIFATIILRLPTLFIEVFNGDETHYATAAMVILDGGIPYVDFVDKKPPLIYSIYAFVFKIFGTDLRFVHGFVLLTVLLTSYYIYKCLRLFSSERAGLLGALLYGIFSPAFIEHDMWAANAEIFMTLPMTVSVFFFLKGYLQKKYLFFSLSGIFLMIGLLTKQQAGILYPVFFLAFIFLSWKSGFTKIAKSILLQGGILFIASLLPLLLIISYFYYVGHIDDFFLWNYTHNFIYIKRSPAFIDVIGKGLFRTFGFIVSTLIMWILGLNYFLKRKNNSRFSKTILTVSSLWLLFTFPAVFVGGRFFGHYYILFYPSLALLGGLGADYFLQKIDEHSKKIKALFITGLILPPLFFYIFGITRFYIGVYQSSRPFIAEVSKVVEKETTSSDKIFSWGLFPYPYYYTKRLPASRFIACEYLVPLWKNRYNKDKQYLPEQLEQFQIDNMALLLSDLEKNKPKIFIDVQRTPHLDNWNLYEIRLFPRLHSYLNKHYKLIKDVEGVYIYKRIN